MLVKVERVVPIIVELVNMFTDDIGANSEEQQERKFGNFTMQPQEQLELERDKAKQTWRCIWDGRLAEQEEQ